MLVDHLLKTKKEFINLISDKVLKDKAFNMAKNPKYDGYQRGLASMVFDKRSASLPDKSVSGSGVVNNKIKENSQLP